MSKDGGICRKDKPRPDLLNIGHHPAIVFFKAENGVKTYHCKTCGGYFIAPKHP